MSNAVEIRAPAEQSEGTRSQVLRWLKSVGDAVEQNEPLIEIETDKVTVEVASPGSGILREIVKHEQEEIAPGELLGRIEAADTAGAGAGGRGTGAGQAAGTGQAARASEAAAAGQAVGARPSGFAPADADTSAANRLSPAVRRLLAEHSLEASAIRGTGAGGRITVEDIMLVVSRGVAGSPQSRGTPAAAEAESDITGKSHRVPHSPVRKRIAEHMVRSLLHTAPHVTTVFEADLTAVLAHRSRNREDFARRGAPLTLTAYFLGAAVHAIRAVPEANSRWTDTALEVFESIHIGVATALEDGGLVVPVLRDVDSRDLFEIASGLEQLVTRAREGHLSPADVRGGTFTISNHGVSGSLLATPIVINQPQAAILGIGKLEKRPVVLDDDGEDRIVILPRCYVTLTIDHRVMDGQRANHFLQTFVERLTSWPA